MKKFNQKKYHKQYHRAHREKINQRSALYRKKHVLELKEYHKNYSKSHKEQRLQVANDYNSRNREKVNQKAKEYYLKNKNRLISDPIKKLRCNLRKRLRDALKGNPKVDATMKLLGCHIDLLRLHLQSKFQPGMSFSNYGKWHIDHIIPCCRFDLTKESEQRKCFHYTNLQPLWATDNLKKGSKT